MKTKKYIFIDLFILIFICLISGILSFCLGKAVTPEQTKIVMVDVFSTITGSLFLAVLLYRIKTKNFKDKLKKNNITNILIATGILLLARVSSGLIYHIISTYWSTMAIIVTAALDIIGIIICIHYLKGEKAS